MKDMHGHIYFVKKKKNGLNICTSNGTRVRLIYSRAIIYNIRYIQLF